MRWILAFLVCGTVLAQRRPDSSCKWVPWESPELGLQMKMAQCEGGAARELKAVSNKVRMIRPGQDPATGLVVIEVWDKPARQKLTEAITRRFSDMMTSRQKIGCETVSMDEKYPRGEGNQVWQIVPNPVYRGEAQQILEGEPGAEVCGPYGVADTPRYFEYHPEQSKTKYLFVRFGHDEMMFDEKSIQIVGK